MGVLDGVTQPGRCGDRVRHASVIGWPAATQSAADPRACRRLGLTSRPRSLTWTVAWPQTDTEPTRQREWRT